MASDNAQYLPSLIQRLEAATLRLENIATTRYGASAAILDTAIAVASRDPGTGSSTKPETLTDDLPKSVIAFGKIIEDDVQAFLKSSESIGGPVEQQSKAVKEAFEAGKAYLLIASRAKRPESMPPELTADLRRHTSTVEEIREANRPSPLYVHLSAVSEGIIALSWVLERRPIDFVKNILGGTQYYGNKILNEYKGKDKSHVEYINAYYKILRSLISYVREYYAFGVVWNDKDGIDVLEALNQVQPNIDDTFYDQATSVNKRTHHGDSTA
ncbi:hypothetical protein AYO20_00534 [Fonsecaea nubica]|uniref:Adenylyl cyclase-associated protein n=1 Tax=Fonsecaea nubica TaxID=856822 RepID=A0A178DEB3_9EURO|nr:hypothetical protein AYO20_00534 [Fonsecaea nubica]OAL40116.1 hypothetical protein AYO20_00534 [Fonsecaea nubica]